MSPLPPARRRPCFVIGSLVLLCLMSARPVLAQDATAAPIVDIVPGKSKKATDNSGQSLGGKPAEAEAARTEATAALPEGPPARGEEIYARLIKSVAWLPAIRPGAAEYKWGTAWVVDRDRRLIVTNQHVVFDNDSDELFADEHFRVYFPEYVDGELMTDRNDRLANGKYQHARLIEVDTARDLAVLQVDELPDDVLAVPLAAHSARPGQAIHSLGNPGSSDALWVYSVGNVRQVYRANERIDNTIYQYLRVETQTPTNQGDSGGPAVNDRGEVVAVNHAARIEGRLMTWFIDVSEVKAVLETVDWMLSAESAEELNRRGVHYHDRGRYDLAIADYTAAIQLDPNLANPVGNRGWAWLAKNDLATAKADFDAAIQLDARDANFYQGRAKVNLALKDYDAALTDCVEAIRLAPSQPAIYNQRGDIFFYQDKYDEAVADYGEAIRLDAQVAEYHNNRGACYSRQSKNEEAIADYARAIELNAAEPQYLYNRASAYQKAGNEVAAVLDFLRLEQTFPSFAAQQRSHYDRRTLRVVNATDERLQVWIKYHTQNTENEWKWFPAPPGEGNWAVFWLDPGEATFLDHDDFRINADRIRFWAGNAQSTEDWNKSTRQWTEYEEQDLPLLPEGGEDGYAMRSYELRLE